MKKGPPSSAFLRTKCALNYDVLIVPRDSLNDIALEHLEGILLLRKSLIYPLEHNRLCQLPCRRNIVHSGEA